MDVGEAIRTRRSTRAFTSEPVARATVEEILEIARFAPSGGNLQPWKVYVTAGQAKDRVIARVAAQLGQHPLGKQSEYRVYPEKLAEPFFSRRSKVGETLYAALGITRSDRASRLAQYAKNWQFFGAPVGMFFTIGRDMQPGQWSDVGMFLQSIMLLARERGLATCAQESWAAWHEEVRSELPIPSSEILFCGMALGHGAPDVPINTFVTERCEVADLAEFHGF